MNGIIGTEMQATAFSSPAALRVAFDDGLDKLLRHDSLGGFVLVLANASHEPSALDRLRAPLAQAFARWSARIDRQDARVIAAPRDDAEVFARLRRLGFDNLGVTRCRRLGPWELQFNRLRALRPPRLSNTRVRHLHKAFDPAGFHFNKPFLRREVFWEGEFAGTPLRLFYNKFPFAELHGLLVPDPEANRPQYLDANTHALIWELAEHLGRTLPGVGFGYNARGGYASVNHLHVQMFMRSTGRYPVEAAEWVHNGGAERYPLAVQRHADCVGAWQAVAGLHASETSYNLLYRPGCLYILPRAMQGSYAHSGWTGGFAWSELTGAVTVFDPAAFEHLDRAAIDAELAKLSVTR
jgi:diadenosine tetraphosphate (Ap4A) HIT family hydrolase